MKKSMLLLMSLLPIFSSGIVFDTTEHDKRKQMEENEGSDSKLRRKNLTLIGKQFENILDVTSCGPASFDRRVVLFFDMDGDTNTTEVVAAKYCPCLATEAKIFDAKIGDTKTSQGWKDALKHKDEERCIGSAGKYSASVFRHRLVWQNMR